MAVQFIITALDDEGEFLSAFGQLVFTGNYTGGGDSVTVAVDAGTAGVAGVNQNTASLPVFLSGQTALRASRPPFKNNIQIESGYIAVVSPGVAATDFKIKVWDPSTKAELGGGAYPVAITGAVFNFLELKYKKNL